MLRSLQRLWRRAKGLFVTDIVIAIRTANAAWFSLADDTYETLYRIAESALTTVKASSMSPEAIAVRVLLRACDTLVSAILVAERGLVSDSRTLVRSLIECALAMAALHDQPNEFVELLKADSEASRRNQGKFIVAKQLVANGAAKDKLLKAMEAIDKDARLMSPRRLAEMGPLVKNYLTYCRLSDDSAHVSARSLNRYVNKLADGAGWNLKWTTGDKDETAVTLSNAVSIAMAVGIGYTQMMRDTDGNEKIGQLVVRFEAIPSAPIL